MLGTTFGKFSSTLSVDVTVINVDTPETSKSQQVVTVFNLNHAGIHLNWPTRSGKGYILVTANHGSST
jgi:hypothetical protein